MGGIKLPYENNHGDSVEKSKSNIGIYNAEFDSLPFSEFLSVMKSVFERPTRVHSLSYEQARAYQFCDYLMQRSEVTALCLFPPRSDFTFACGCVECCHKMKELKDFETEIKSKSRQLLNYRLQWEATVDHCIDLSTAIAWSKNLLDWFHTNLKAASGVSLTSTEVEAAKLQMDGMLVASGLLDSYPTDKPLKACEIGDGLDFYEESKFKDEAHCLLKMIEELEKKHQGAKKSADAKNEQLAHSSSITFIEEQIKLVEKLPVKKLLQEAEELIPHVTPIAVYSDTFENARKCITDTCRAMVKERWEFWLQYEARPSEGTVEDHNLNGLGDTFESLLDKAESFKNEWEKEYAPILRKLECLLNLMPTMLYAYQLV